VRRGRAGRAHLQGIERIRDPRRGCSRHRRRDVPDGLPRRRGPPCERALRGTAGRLSRRGVALDHRDRDAPGRDGGASQRARARAPSWHVPGGAVPLALGGAGARAAMIAPLRTSSGVAGAVGVVRYLRTEAEESLPFTLMELQYLTAVAAYIAGGLELSEAVSGARAAAERAHAMVDGSPLPMALVDRSGRVEHLNQAA